jgi:hypothetical protein
VTNNWDTLHYCTSNPLQVNTILTRSPSSVSLTNLWFFWAPRHCLDWRRLLDLPRRHVGSFSSSTALKQNKRGPHLVPTSTLSPPPSAPLRCHPMHPPTPSSCFISMSRKIHMNMDTSSAWRVGESSVPNFGKQTQKDKLKRLCDGHDPRGGATMRMRIKLSPLTPDFATHTRSGFAGPTFAVYSPSFF